MSSDNAADKTYAPSPEFVANAHIDAAKYQEMYAASINDPDAFWSEQMKRLTWAKTPTRSKTPRLRTRMSRSNGSKMVN